MRLITNDTKNIKGILANASSTRMLIAK